MNKTLLKSVREYKKQSFLTPFFVILEVLLAVCLNRIPIWVHGLIIIGQIVAGLGFHALVFMILMAGVYFAAILLLYFWTKDN